MKIGGRHIRLSEQRKKQAEWVRRNIGDIYQETTRIKEKRYREEEKFKHEKFDYNIIKRGLLSCLIFRFIGFTNLLDECPREVIIKAEELINSAILFIQWNLSGTFDLVAKNFISSYEEAGKNLYKITDYENFKFGWESKLNYEKELKLNIFWKKQTRV